MFFSEVIFLVAHSESIENRVRSINGVSTLAVMVCIMYCNAVFSQTEGHMCSSSCSLAVLFHCSPLLVIHIGTSVPCADSQETLEVCCTTTVSVWLW